MELQSSWVFSVHATRVPHIRRSRHGRLHNVGCIAFHHCPFPPTFRRAPKVRLIISLIRKLNTDDEVRQPCGTLLMEYLVTRSTHRMNFCSIILDKQRWKALFGQLNWRRLSSWGKWLLSHTDCILVWIRTKQKFVAQECDISVCNSELNTNNAYTSHCLKRYMNTALEKCFLTVMDLGELVATFEHLDPVLSACLHSSRSRHCQSLFTAKTTKSSRIARSKQQREIKLISTNKWAICTGFKNPTNSPSSSSWWWAWTNWCKRLVEHPNGFRYLVSLVCSWGREKILITWRTSGDKSRSNSAIRVLPLEHLPLLCICNNCNIWLRKHSTRLCLLAKELPEEKSGELKNTNSITKSHIQVSRSGEFSTSLPSGHGLDWSLRVANEPISGKVTGDNVSKAWKAIARRWERWSNV